MYKELIKRLRDLPHLMFVQLGEHEELVYQAADAIEEVEAINEKQLLEIAVLAKERKKGKNIATEYDEVDQFVCSECGIELQNWVRVERDEDDGDETHHEYRFNFCPNCGADCREEET